MRNYNLIINGSKVNYYEFGNKNNQIIICFHGLAGNCLYSFSEIAVLLEKDFHLIIIDSPGHGKTSSFDKENDYLFSALAMWYQQVIQRITPKPFYILGHSWGADLAIHFTKHNPSAVLGVIMLDGGYTFPQNQPEMNFNYAIAGWNDYMDRSVFTDQESIFEEYKLYTKNWDKNREGYVLSLFKKKDNRFELVTSKFTVLSIIKAFFEESFIEAYPFIKVPLLLIHATSPKNLDDARAIGISQLNNNLNDVTVISMKGGGHMLQWDEPERTAKEVKEWIMKKSGN
ncbi:alpha/beta hydrolase [Psychrobacillus sp. FJAT-51614]|uniref:Alpha/beta hydrolase n=1 Tax=Psychrobacillus mangrovi TaxID=3117745 RepID=A0ABU8FCA9_9BACI